MQVKWSDAYKGEWSDNERDDFISRFEKKILPVFIETIKQLPMNSMAVNIYEKVVGYLSLRVDFEVHPVYEGKTPVTIIIYPWNCVNKPESIIDPRSNGISPWLMGTVET